MGLRMMTEDIVQSQPLTVAQRGLWMASFIAPAGSTFNIAEAIDLPGHIDENTFMKALAQVADEAETLRARIVETGSGPRQRILRKLQNPCISLDMRSASKPREAAQDWMAERIRAPVDLSTDQLWQNALIRVGDEHFIWFHCCHHSVLDGYSGGMVAARVAAIYSAQVAAADPGPSPFLAASALVEQEALYRGSKLQQVDRKYWLEHLAEPPEPLTLSLRPQRAPNGEFGGFISRRLNLSQDRIDGLAELTRQFEVTLPQALTALVVAYLQRATGEHDLIVGMPVSGRANRILRRTPGMVANAVALRFRVGPDTSFADLMAQSRRAMRSALRHQQFRYEDLRRELGFHSSSQQIARVGINIEPFDYNLAFGDIAARNSNLSNGAMEDLTVFVFDRRDGGGLTIQFDANPALYTADELDAHLARLDHLATRLMAQPESPLGEHSILTEADRRKADARARATGRLWPHNHVTTMLRTALTARPDATAITDDSGGLTRSELWQAIQDLAERLAGLGIGSGELVAIALPRDRRMVIAVAAVAMSGAAWLPINVSEPAARTQLILDDAEPALVITSGADGIEHTDARCTLLLDEPHHPLRDVRITGTVPAIPRPTPLPANSAYVTYTSGTSGLPKGVVVPHHALANLLCSMADTLGFDQSTHLLAVTNLTFDIAALELLLPLVADGSLVIATRDDVLDPKRLVGLIEAHSVNTMQATPTLWQSLLTVRDGEALRSLKVLCGGEMLPGHLARRLFACARTVFNLYGPTETTIWSTAHRLTEADLDDPPIGLPIANTQLFIIDPDGRPLPDGVVGQLAIGGDGVASGYLNRPALTAERFVATPQGPAGQRIYRTGDRAAREPSGIVRLFGRNDDQIKIRGMRIEPGEIETALLGLENVSQAAVVAERETPGAAASLAAYLVPAEPATKLDAAEIRRLLLAVLPSQMVPARIVPVEALPRTSSGKLDRAALKSIKVPVGRGGTVTARTPAERMLSDLWSSLLGIREIDVDANFFDLGGDSLMALQLVAALSERGYELPVGQLFSVPTIAALAPYFENATPRGDPLASVLPIRKGGHASPIFCIHPVIGLGWGFSGLAALLPDHHPVYALQHAKPVLEGTAARDLGALAEMHLREIRRIQPSGPYHLIGWSMGGLLAHAMASALQDEGETIGLLALMDAYPYHEAASTGPVDSPDMVRAVMDFLSISLPAEPSTPKSLDELADAILAVELAQIPTHLRASGGKLDDLITDLRRVTLHNIDLVRSFRPGHSDLDMIFVRASRRGGKRADALINDRAEIWNRHTSGEISFYDVDCRHQDMLQPGYVEQLAKILTSHLDPSDRHVRATRRPYFQAAGAVEAAQ